MENKKLFNIYNSDITYSYIKMNKKKVKDFFVNIKKKMTPSQFFSKIFIFYFLIVILGMFILAIPGVVHSNSIIYDKNNVAHKVHYDWNFLLSLFNASSAFSDTGLSIPSAGEDYSIVGQIVIATLIELGGFGVMTFKIMLLLYIGKKINIKDLLLVQDERGANDVSSALTIIKESFLFLFFLQIFGAFALCFSFYFINTANWPNNHMYHNFGSSLWGGFFHSISSINNAGFDIIGRHSIQPYKHVYIVQIIFLLEFIIGGIGFPTFYDLKRTKFGFDKSKKLSLFTKVNLITYFLISFIGVGLVFAIEYGNRSSSMIIANSTSGFDSFMAIFFNTMSTRNAGFSSVDISQFLNGSKIVQFIMMFIGSAPSSTAGGIRTTTFAIIIMSLIAFMKNRNQVVLFKRQVPKKTVYNSFMVLILSILLVLLTTGTILSLNNNLNPINTIYTIISAFGTTGLSALSTWNMYNMNAIGLICLIILMFVGQLGITTTLLSWGNKNKTNKYQYAEENIKIG